MPALPQYDWILALTSIAFIFSAFGNGANDVANSYATSVAARTLTMPQVGFLAMCTEFIGAVALGSRVTGTIRSAIIDIQRYEPRPAVLMLAMGCAEVANATWLMSATGWGWPVSTTQTIVGALVGVGIASEAAVSWGWADGSVSQVAASWAIAPLIAACFSAILYGTVKFAVLERQDSFKWAMRLIPWYLAFTAAVLALFIVVEAPTVDSLEELGAGTAVGIILGTFAGVLAIAYIFFMPYFRRRLVMKDSTVRIWHLPLGPLLDRESTKLYWPGNPDEGFVQDYYFNPHAANAESSAPGATASEGNAITSGSDVKTNTSSPTREPKTLEDAPPPPTNPSHKRSIEPEERFLAPTKDLPLYNPKRLWSWFKYLLLQGVTRDCVSHSDPRLLAVHARAKHYDNRVEHLWTYAQVASAMMMSIAHGSNDVANAVAPWVSSYAVYNSGIVEEDVSTPVWILVISGFLLGAGFWFYGYHIIRAMGNKITQMSPTRGFSMELGAAITVLIASRLGLPVSTTQCLTGAMVGVALMNFDLRAVNWRQIGFIFMGWIFTLPSAGFIGGVLMVMALNAPHL